MKNLLIILSYSFIAAIIVLLLFDIQIAEAACAPDQAWCQDTDAGYAAAQQLHNDMQQLNNQITIQRMEERQQYQNYQYQEHQRELREAEGIHVPNPTYYYDGGH